MFIENLRCAYRNLRTSPGFTLTAVLSLGIGIGGTVSMFTLVKSILLKPLAYREPNKLVLITITGADLPSYSPTFGLAAIHFLRWRNEIRSFESLTVMRASEVNLTGSGTPQTLGCVRISAEFFDTLGLKPQLGRWFRREEEKRGMPRVAIISAELWRRHFSSDPDIVGKKIILNGAPHDIIGITPPELRFFRGRQLHVENAFPERTDIFVPVRFTVPEEQGLPSPNYLAIGRLKAGVTPGEVRAELDSSLPTMQFNPPIDRRMYWSVIQPLQTALVAETGKALWLLLSAVGFVLLIACINVANLSLMRTAQRTRELAIRVALGATRRDLLGYSFAESLVLALTGTVVGVVISVWVIDGVVVLAPAQLPRLDETSIDRGVFLFAVAVCALTTVLLGVLPAWRAAQIDPQESLRGACRAISETRRSGRVHAVLVSAEVTFGTLLAIGSGLLIVSLHNTMNASLGFTADHVLVADFKLPPDKYQTTAARDRFFRGLRDELAPLPGVSHIAATRLLPLNTELFVPVVTEDSEAAGPIQPRFLTAPNVTSDYFQAMGIPLREGRFFREGETDEVAVISESAARILWPGENPIGRKVAQPEQIPKTWLRVVGVAGDVLSAGLDRPSTPAIYRPFSRYGTLGFTLVIRTAVSDGFRETLGRAIAKVDAEIPVPETRTISELIGKSTGQRRFQTALFTVFALTAVLLAAIGVYGVVAFSVLQRMREIGLRVALGADARDVMQLVFRYGMAPVVVGLAAGIGMATVFSKVMASLLFKASAFDPVIFIGAALVCACAGAVPCWLMTRRALRIDPALCLRAE